MHNIPPTVKTVGFLLVFFMKISKERYEELGLGCDKEACLSCEFCFDCFNTDEPSEIEKAIQDGYECPGIDKERLREEMTEEEYDAWRHGRLEVTKGGN